MSELPDFVDASLPGSHSTCCARKRVPGRDEVLAKRFGVPLGKSLARTRGNEDGAFGFLFLVYRAHAGVEVRFRAPYAPDG